jgi:hypothetical protein
MDSVRVNLLSSARAGVKRRVAMVRAAKRRVSMKYVLLGNGI